MKAIYVLGMILMFGSSLMAQSGPPKERPTAEQRAKENTERMKKELLLTADQEKKVYDINLASAKKMDEAFKSAQGNRDVMREKMTAIRADQDKQIKAILTAEQAQKYDELVKKMEEERKQKHQGGPGGGQNPPVQ